VPYIHVHNPTQGIDTSNPPYYLPAPEGIGPRATDYAKGVVIGRGEVRSDYGYVQFPTAGATKTNYLHGSVLLLKQFKKLDGNTFTLALTTTNAYHYNTSTSTWDNVTRGEIVEDCEDAWTANANVTSTADSAIKLRGTNSVKLAFAAGFTTGVAAYENFSSTDLTGNTALHFWIYSSIALNSGDYKIRLSEANDGGTGATNVEFDLPTIAANTWTPCCVDGDFSGLNAVLSVAIVGVVDKGAHDLYIDDIRAVIRFTGDEDNRFSAAMFDQQAIVTNGVDHPQKYDGTASTGFQLLSTTLSAGDIATSEIVLVMRDHVVFMNNTENGADAPQRVSWGNIGELEDYVGGTAGYQDLVDDSDWIISALPMDDDTAIIYKENSIVEMRWVGGQTPFRFTTVYQGDGSAGKDCVYNVRGKHAIIGNRYVYTYSGTKEIVQEDEKFNKSFYDSIDTTYINRSFIVFDKSTSELQFWIPTADTVPDDIWAINSIDSEHPIYRKTRTASGFGFFTTQAALTIGDLIGTIGEQNYRIGDALTKANFPTLLLGNTSGKVFQISQSTYNNDGAAITNEFQTPDFTPPVTTNLLRTSSNTNEGSLLDFFRVTQLIYEAKGDSVTTEFSVDGGSTWNPTQGNATNVQALNSAYAIYQQDFDVTARKIRFRFRNTSASSGFFMRYFALYYHPRSTRR